MGKIIYEITGGIPPFTVDLVGNLIPGGLQNIHADFGIFEFLNVPFGIYTLTITDSTASEIVCEEVELIQPCVTCPTGYAPIGNTCQKTDIVGAEEFLPLATIGTTQRIEYSSKGTLVFEDDWTYEGTGTFEKINPTNEYWTNDWTSTVKGPMNRSSVWVTPVRSYQDIEFSTCIDIALTKQYYIGVGCDNWSYIKLNGEKILEQNIGALADMLGITSNEDRIPFNYWFIYPIQLTEGRNILEVAGHNETSAAGVGIEIYDATKTTLMAATSDEVLGSALLFRASDLDGLPMTYESSRDYGYHGYICPPGYALVTCDGPYHCAKKEIVECEQLLAEIDTSTIIFTPDCSIITFPHLSNTGMNKTYIMYTYFEPDRLLTEFESIEIVRLIPSDNAEIKYNGVSVVKGQIIDFSEQNAIEIYTINYLEEDTITDIYFKIKLVEELLPTQELHYRFINEACEETSVPVAMYVSVDVIFDGNYNFLVEESILYNPGVEVQFTNPIISGWHYMFISVPSGRTFTIKDPLNIDITNRFSFYQVDNRAGFANNSIYRLEEPFGTNDPVIFKITLI